MTVNDALARACSRSPWLKRSLWKSWYGFLASRYRRQGDWTFMNYGYAPLDGAEPLSLQAADEADRCAIQLYHRVASGADLRGTSVLEVGCGRGGGSSYVARYLGARSVLGVDYSPEAVRFCESRHSVPGLSFRQGDAESLPCAENSFDAVLNVESSHCYGSMPAFLGEVHRVLKPGGHFLWADMRPHDRVGETLEQFQDAGLTLVEQASITANVLHGLELVAEGRADMIRRLAPAALRPFVRDFAGVPGTRVHESLRSGAVEYVACVLRKPI